MKQYQLQKGYIPEAVSSKYPWKDMKIGDSFFVESDRKTRTVIQRNGKNYLLRNQIKGKKIITRRWVEEGAEGYRFYMVSGDHKFNQTKS